MKKPHLRREGGQWLCVTPSGASCRAQSAEVAYRTAMWMQGQHDKASRRARSNRGLVTIDRDVLRRLLEPQANPGDGVLRFGGSKTLRDRISYAFND